MEPIASGPPIILAAFLVSAGVTLYAGIQTAIVGIVRHRVPLYLAFAAMSFCATGFQFATIGYYSAGSIPAAALALQWQASFALLFHPALFVFVALYTRQERITPWFVAIALAFGGFLVANLVAPNSLRFTTLEAATPLRFPWGETLARFSGPPGIENGLVRAAHLGVFFWATWRAVAHFRRGHRRAALFLAACILLVVAASTWAALIDLGVIDSVYVTGFSFLGLVLLMSASLGMELHDQTTRLEATSVELRKENEQRGKAEQQVRRMAYQDHLTGLANRGSFHERLAETIVQAARTGQYGAILLIDLDHFKTINEALSHDVGDQVLREVARRLIAIAGERAFVARLGGDEFVMVVSGVSTHQQETIATARELAETVQSDLSKALPVGEHVFNVGASIGIAPFPSDGSTSKDILRHADMALYRAKNLGRRTNELYAPAMSVAADERLKLERSLRVGLENGEISLYFQPQIDAAGRLVGAEAMMRWRHPEMGMILPASFIPIAEETGLIHTLATWMFERVCDRLVAWSQAAVPFDGVVAINVSPWQFTRPDFVLQVEGTLTRSGVAPSRVTLEITETALLYDLQETVRKLTALRTLGIKIALDDFGTGYSSLAYLRVLPLDQLKIDRAFVNDLGIESGRALVESMISIGQHMKLQVIAEGVESASQRDTLLSMGCRYFQGYLFSYPLAEQEFLRWIAENHQATGPSWGR
ncbi:MAG: EAL domain-containing protein [Nitrospirota bacterium]